MDISNLSNMYADIYGTQSSETTSKLESQLNTDYSTATEDELLDACKQFESYFVEQMFKEMMKTIPESEEESAYTSSLMDYYKDSLVQEVAGSSTEQEGLGLAQMLYEQMKRNYNL